MLLLDEPLGALDLKLRKQMQLELKAIQHEVGITFVHVTHDQEEAMTMADTIAVMNEGRIEQLGPPTELYERPTTAFVAGFLGVSNLLHGTGRRPRRVRLDGGATSRLAARRSTGAPAASRSASARRRSGSAPASANALAGTVVETRVHRRRDAVRRRDAAPAPITVYVQNAEPGARSASPGDAVTLSWSPDATFVVDLAEEDSSDDAPP